MDNEIKKTYLLTKTPGKELQINVYYDKGGINMFSGKNEPRGYWLSVRPVERDEKSVSFSITEGLRVFLLEVKKRGEKNDQQALKLSEEKQGEVVGAVAAKYGLELAQ